MGSNQQSQQNSIEQGSPAASQTTPCMAQWSSILAFWPIYVPMFYFQLEGLLNPDHHCITRVINSLSKPIIHTLVND